MLHELRQNHPEASQMQVWWPKAGSTSGGYIKILHLMSMCKGHPFSCSIASMDMTCKILTENPYWFCQYVPSWERWSSLLCTLIPCVVTRGNNKHFYQHFKSLVSSYGLPLQLVSDNCPKSTSKEFLYFVKANGVKYIKCSILPIIHCASRTFRENFQIGFESRNWWYYCEPQT